MAITFYYGSGSAPAWRVWLALEHKRLAYEWRLMSFSDGDLKQPEFRRLNPRGRVPTIVDDDFVLYESNAIVEYLEERYPATPPLFPGATQDRARVRRTISEVDDDFDGALSKLASWVLWTPKAEWQDDKIAAARQAVLTELDYVASRMGGDYLCGNALTAADFALYPLVATLARCDLKMPALELVASRPAKLRAWAARIEALPYFARTVPPHWTA